jgi:hypothetical protein
MVSALRATSPTDFGAEAAKIVRELRIALKQGGRGPADLGAVAIEPDTLGHHRDMGLAQTSREALFARPSALDTGFDARLVIRERHDSTPDLVTRRVSERFDGIPRLRVGLWRELAGAIFLEGVDLALYFVFRQSELLLQEAFELIAFAFDLFDFIIGELAPFFFDLAFELFPIACQRIPIHKSPISKEKGT